MLDLGLATNANRPAELWIWNQSEMSEIICRKKLRVDLTEGAQHRLWKNFRAHRAVQEKFQIVLRPGRHLLDVDLRRCRYCLGRMRGGASEQKRGQIKCALNHCHLSKFKKASRLL